MDNESSWLSPTFVIGTIHIGHIEGASCVNMGNNFPVNFRSYKKHNQGFGAVNGNSNLIQGARTLLNDPDTLDMVSFDDTQLPDWVQELISNTSPPTGISNLPKESNEEVEP